MPSSSDARTGRVILSWRACLGTGVVKNRRLQCQPAQTLWPEIQPMAQRFACKGWRALGSQLVLERLDNSLDLLAPGRQSDHAFTSCGSGQNKSCRPSMASPSWNIIRESDISYI